MERIVIKRYIDNGKYGYIRVRLDDGTIMLEHRFVMEKHLGRKLRCGEFVHHIDENKHNNDILNLKITSNSEHVSQHVSGRGKVVAVFKCPICGKVFSRDRRKSHLVKGGNATYCGRSCSAVASNSKFVDVSDNVQKVYYTGP